MVRNKQHADSTTKSWQASKRVYCKSGFSINRPGPLILYCKPHRAEQLVATTVGALTSGTAATSRKKMPALDAFIHVDTAAMRAPITIQRSPLLPTAAPHRCLRPVCTSATSSGTSGSLSEKIAKVSPAGLR